MNTKHTGKSILRHYNRGYSKVQLSLLKNIGFNFSSWFPTHFNYNNLSSRKSSLNIMADQWNTFRLKLEPLLIEKGWIKAKCCTTGWQSSWLTSKICHYSTEHHKTRQKNLVDIYSQHRWYISHDNIYLWWRNN